MHLNGVGPDNESARSMEVYVSQVTLEGGGAGRTVIILWLCSMLEDQTNFRTCFWPQSGPWRQMVTLASVIANRITRVAILVPKTSGGYTGPKWRNRWWQELSNSPCYPCDMAKSHGSTVTKAANNPYRPPNGTTIFTFLCHHCPTWLLWNCSEAR